jgi:hypothetical protein
VTFSSAVDLTWSRSRLCAPAPLWGRFGRTTASCRREPLQRHKAVDTKRSKFDPQKFEDHYEDALKELLKKKQKGEKIEAPREARPSNVVNLMDALRASVNADHKRPPARSAHQRARARKPASRTRAKRRAG